MRFKITKVISILKMTTNEVILLLGFVIVIYGLMSCKPTYSSKGFTLQNFEISNYKLDSKGLKNLKVGLKITGGANTLKNELKK
jgi:hypothetical protein